MAGRPKAWITSKPFSESTRKTKKPRERRHFGSNSAAMVFSRPSARLAGLPATRRQARQDAQGTAGGPDPLSGRRVSSMATAIALRLHPTKNFTQK